MIFGLSLSIKHMGVHDYFFYLCGKSPRSWWNHFTLTPEVSVQLEAVNQWQVSTRTINLRPAPLASCSLPFQQGSYFSAWPSLPIQQSRFHLLIEDFFDLLCSEGGPEGGIAPVLYFPCLFTVSCQQDGGSDASAFPSAELQYIRS